MSKSDIYLINRNTKAAAPLATALFALTEPSASELTVAARSIPSESHRYI